jgi:hypothetical protein
MFGHGFCFQIFYDFSDVYGHLDEMPARLFENVHKSRPRRSDEIYRFCDLHFFSNQRLLGLSAEKWTFSSNPKVTDTPINDGLLPFKINFKRI